jgi:hypothetical protein
MTGSIVRLISVIGLVAGGFCLRAEDKSLVGPVPAHQDAPQASAATPIEILPYQRINRRAVWQYYGVDRHGTWRPRVVWSAFGAYYLFNGEPYYYAPTRPRDFMPYATD